MSDMEEKRIPTRETQPVSRPTRLQAMLLFVIAAAGLLLTGVVFAFVPEGMNPRLRELLSNLFFYAVFLALPVLACIRRGPGSPANLRPNPISFLDVFIIVMLAVMAVFLVNDIIVLWSIPLQKLGFDVNAGGMAVPVDTPGLLLCILSGAVIPGICEELLFRGAILSAFERQGTRRAVWISALLFMLLHGSVVGAPTQLLLGLIMAELVICCNSIYAGLIFHTAYNAALFIIVSAQQRSMPDPGPVGDYFSYIGGWGGVLSMLISIALSGFILRMVMRSFRLRALMKGTRDVDLPPAAGEALRGKEIVLILLAALLTGLLYALDISHMLAPI